MKAGSKYQPLFEFLSRHPAGEISLTFSEIEALIGAGLPPSARNERGWWSNRTGALQASAWMQAGYHVTRVDLGQESVAFARPVTKYEIRREGDTILWDSNLIKALRKFMGFNQNQLADELGVRQQTISEWETRVYSPSRASCKHLSLIAERAGFDYGEK